MKYKIISYVLITLAALNFAACNLNVNDNNSYYDTEPPAPPTGVYVLNGDNRVDISWNSNRENDVAGYNVYYAYSYSGKYTLIGSTKDSYFVDYDAVNGNAYFYAIAAYDFNGNESDLSHDVVYSTPRPEGYNQSVFDYRKFPNTAGYSFGNYSTIAYDDKDADFFFENFEGTYYLDVWDDSDIQDMGETNDIYDISEAPAGGWSSTKDVSARAGHTYVIWTWDNHFAKIRVKSITPERIVFDWAFQLVKGERQLKPKAVPAIRKDFNKEWLNTKRSAQ